MREIRTSGLMSGDRKRDALHTRAGPRLYRVPSMFSSSEVKVFYPT